MQLLLKDPVFKSKLSPSRKSNELTQLYSEGGLMPKLQQLERERLASNRFEGFLVKNQTITVDRNTQTLLKRHGIPVKDCKVNVQCKELLYVRNMPFKKSSVLPPEISYRAIVDTKIRQSDRFRKQAYH